MARALLRLYCVVLLLSVGLLLYQIAWFDRVPVASEEAEAAGMATAGAGGRLLRGGALPFLYGTAWKKERTLELVQRAVLAGFRGIDTACQPKHYREDLVGAAVRALGEEHGIRRDQLWLQTKFTPLPGQDPAATPYDPTAPLTEQVSQSLERSLANLGTDYIDSLVLHSPLGSRDDTLAVWRRFEAAVDDGSVRQLGISNLYSPAEFAWLHGAARHKPAVLQNRFYADTGYDKELREFCLQHGVTYQTFWTLTANPHLLGSAVVERTAARLAEATDQAVTGAQVLFKFLIQAGHQPLTGTTSEAHMAQALAAPRLPDLTEAEVAAIRALLE